jgi:hypothetical protein
MRIYLQGVRGRFVMRPSAPDPVAPTIVVTAIAGDEINIEWTLAEADDAEVVEIEQSTTSGSGFANITLVETLGETTGTFTATGLTPNTTYYFQARSFKDSALIRYSAYSAEDSDTTPAAGSTLAQPANLAATETARDATTITYTLSWDAVANADSYDWWVEASIDGGYSNGSSGAPNNSVTNSAAGIAVTRPAVGDETVFVVAGRDENGQGANTRLAVNIEGTMLPPTFDSASLSGDDVTITYTEHDAADAVDNYQVERDSGAGFVVISTEAVGAAQPQHVDSNLAAGDHTYRIRGYDTDTDTYTAYSAERTVTVVSALTAGTSTAIPGDNTVALTANAPTGGTAPYTYQWHRSTDGSKGSALSGATSLSHDDDTAVNDTLYYYTLTATDAVAASVDYTQRQATPGSFAAPDVAFADMEDSTLGDFLTQGGSNTGSSDISIIDDPTGQFGGKVIRIQFPRTNTAGAADVNRAVQHDMSPDAGFTWGETFYISGQVYIATPIAEMADAQRKLFYPQHKPHNNAAICFLKAEATKTGYDQALKVGVLKYPTGNRAITASEGIDFDTKTSLELRVTVNSAFDVADGIIQLWKDGRLVIDDSAAVVCRDPTLTNGYRRIKIGDQVQHLQNDKSVLYTDVRYWNNIAISSQRIGAS